MADRAEQRAFEAYPVKMRYVGIDSVKDGHRIDVNKPMRERYIKAYHQAEKDILSEYRWHDASEMPYDKASCLIYYKVGDKVSYQDVFPVIYNADRKEFVSEPYPHTTGYKVEQKSLEGGVVADVYRNMRDRFPLEDISKWAYLDDIINL